MSVVAGDQVLRLPMANGRPVVSVTDRGTVVVMRDARWRLRWTFTPFPDGVGLLTSGVRSWWPWPRRTRRLP